jgi:hypothetical protein
VKFSTHASANQLQALNALAGLIRKGGEHPRVRAAALRIVSECPSRDDECELQAIFDAVKSGTPLVRGLRRGLPYRADPKSIDFFASADRMLSMCEHDACGEDCDGHCVLNGALAHSLGFTVGARAYGKSPGEYVHVYAVALVPKRAQFAGANAKIVGMDTTVPRSYLGWQPPPGHYKTSWA